MKTIPELAEGKNGENISIAPGRYFEVRQNRYLAKQRLFQVCGLSPLEIRKLICDLENAKYILSKGITMYGHDGAIIGDGGSAATFALPIGIDAANVIDKAAASHGLEILSKTTLDSRDPTSQRVRVVFAPGTHPREFFKDGFPVQVGERIAHVRVFAPQHRETADAISNASSGGAPMDVLSAKDMQELSEELCKQTIDSEQGSSFSGDSMMDEMKNGTWGKGGKGSGSKTGEWDCPKCQCFNYSHRQKCFRCDAPREEPQSSGAAAGKGPWGDWGTGAPQNLQPKDERRRGTAVAARVQNSASKGKGP
eukprot:gene2660-703_t